MSVVTVFEGGRIGAAGRPPRASESREEASKWCGRCASPRGSQLEDYFCYFSSEEPGTAAERATNEPQRLALYRLTAALVRAYANIANRME
jgi:type I restriction enzyme, R subunit